MCVSLYGYHLQCSQPVIFTAGDLELTEMQWKSCIRLLCPWNLKRQCIGIKSWLRILCLKFQRWINSQTKILITGAIIIVYNNNTFQFWFWFVIEIFNFDLFKLRCTHLNVCAAVWVTILDSTMRDMRANRGEKERIIQKNECDKTWF